MTRSALLLAVAAVLAGATVLFAILGAVFNLLLLAAAVPFGLAAYLLWLHATGRLAARVRRDAVAGDHRGPRQRVTGPTRGGARSRTRATGRDRPGEPGRSMGRREALRVLDLQPGADQRAIRRAYRERVKAVHPDAEGGDEDAFRRVTAAYERLRGR